MKQVVPKNFKNKVRKVKKIKTFEEKQDIKKILKEKYGQKYGTSKLERDFAKQFLDANGIDYVYQYEAKDIGRYFDFAITSDKRKYIKEDKDGLKSIKQDDPSFDLSFFIEIDGSYYHSDPRLVDEKKMNPMQKHNKFVDKIKDTYAAVNCIPLVRFWEEDIRKHPEKVMEELKKYISIADRKRRINENKKKPH